MAKSRISNRAWMAGWLAMAMIEEFQVETLDTYLNRARGVRLRELPNDDR